MQAMVVAQDVEERELIVLVLRRVGLAVASGSNLTRVLETWTDHPADIIVMTLDESQKIQETVQAVRKVTSVHLLVIADPVPEREYCAALDAGADMLLVRPVSPQVLSAHTAVAMRRVGSLPSFVLPTLSLNKITLDPATRTVILADQEPKRLTQREFSLLYVLMTNRGHVVPLEAIVERVWGYSGEGNKDLVRGLVSRLRQKIDPEGSPEMFIETIPGVGYRFLADDV